MPNPVIETRASRLSMRLGARTLEPNTTRLSEIQALDAHFEAATDRGRLRDYSSALLSSPDRNADPFADVQRTWPQLQLPDQPPEQLIEHLLTPAVEISDRSYRMRKFPCGFVDKEACDWLQPKLGVDRTRTVAVGELLRQLGGFYHVTRQCSAAQGVYDV